MNQVFVSEASHLKSSILLILITYHTSIPYCYYYYYYYYYYY